MHIYIYIYTKMHGQQNVKKKIHNILSALLIFCTCVLYLTVVEWNDRSMLQESKCTGYRVLVLCLCRLKPPLIN